MEALYRLDEFYRIAQRNKRKVNFPIVSSHLQEISIWHW